MVYFVHDAFITIPGSPDVRGRGPGLCYEIVCIVSPIVTNK